MFGITTKDYFLSNAKVRSVITAGKTTSNDALNPREYTIIGPIVLDNSTGPVEYNLEVDLTGLVTGTTVMVLFTITNVNTNPVLVNTQSNVYSSFGTGLAPGYGRQLDFSLYEQVQFQLNLNGNGILINTFDFDGVP